MAKPAAKKVKAEKPAKVKEPKGSKLPKTLAGVKIPKSLRQSASSLVSLIETPLGRQIIADVLIAAAGALVAHKPASVSSGGEIGDADTSGTETARRILPSSAGDSESEADGDAKPARKGAKASETTKPARAARSKPGAKAGKTQAE
jgi:hypothetical protein